MAGGTANGEEGLRPGIKGQITGNFTFRDFPWWTLMSFFKNKHHIYTKKNFKEHPIKRRDYSIAPHLPVQDIRAWHSPRPQRASMHCHRSLPSHQLLCPASLTTTSCMSTCRPSPPRAHARPPASPGQGLGLFSSLLCSQCLTAAGSQ